MKESNVNVKMFVQNANSPQTVDIKNKTNKGKQCQKQNISRNKLE